MCIPKALNWVGKSSDFTNPFVRHLFADQPGGKVKKMSSSSSVSHMSTTIHIPKCSNLRAGLRGVLRTERLSFLIFSHKN